MAETKNDLIGGGAAYRSVQVLLCDDDPAFLQWQREAVTAALWRMGTLASVHAFCSGEEIPAALLAECDMAILDIDFPRKAYNGIDIARRLRAARKDAVILFVTNYVEYAPEGYEVQAFRYLLKSEVKEKLPQYLHLALEQLQSQHKTLQIQVGGEKIGLLLEDILYLESQKHTVTAYVRRGNGIKPYSFYASLASLEEALEKEGFLRVQKSYLVNMRHLQKYQCREAILTGGITLRVSEKSYAEQKKKYLLWKGRQ